MKKILLIVLVIAIMYLFLGAYTNKIEKINNGEITQISESYRDR